METASGAELIPCDAAEAALTVSVPANRYVFAGYMQAVSPDQVYIINNTFFPGDPPESMAGLSDADIAEMGALPVDEMAAAGTAVEKWDMTDFGCIPAFRLWEVTADGSVHGLQYFTVRDHTGVNVTLFSYTGESVNEELTAFMDSLLATAVLDD